MSDRTFFQRVRDEKGLVVDIMRYRVARLRFRRLPRGDGHIVLIIPAFSVTDRATWPMRRILKRVGYKPRGWGLGANRGVSDEVFDALRDRLHALYEASGEPVSVVGWSLGGVLARMLARDSPEIVRRVITLGAPYRDAEEKRGLGALAVPATSIYSKSDAVVNWMNATEPETRLADSVEVRGTHSGLALNPTVIEIVALRLADPVVTDDRD